MLAFPHSLLLNAKSLRNPESEAVGLSGPGRCWKCRHPCTSGRLWLGFLSGPEVGQKTDDLSSQGHYRSLEHNHRLL